MKSATPANSSRKSTSIRWRYALVSHATSVGGKCRYDRDEMRRALLEAVVEREGPLLEALRVHPPKGISREEIESAIDEAIEVATKPSQGRYASEIEAEPIQWLWPGRIAARKLTVIDGDPGTGKSTLTIDIAAKVSTGTPFPDGETCSLGTAILVTAEDGPADTIKPRLEVAGADLSRVVVLSPSLAGGGGLVELPKDLAVLEENVLKVKATLIVLDPFSAFLGGDVDGYKDQDIRKIMTMLSAMAERCACAVVLIRHLGKGDKSNALYRGLGSVGVIAAARAGFVVAHDPTDGSYPGRRVFCATKSNLAPLAPALAFRLIADPQRKVARVEWCAEPVSITADELLASVDGKQERGLGDAVALLTEQLKDGPKLATVIEQIAQEAAVSQRTLQRARSYMKIQSKKASGALNAGWILSLLTCRNCEPDRENRP
jgi:KaiC/GvpD/RAD55 family RecA-like ATPase